MKNNKDSLLTSNHVVGPIDRMFRAVIGLVVLITSFAFDLNIVEMTKLFCITIYFWLTGLTGWDPFYSLAYKAWHHFKTEYDISGRF